MSNRTVIRSITSTYLSLLSLFFRGKTRRALTIESRPQQYRIGPSLIFFHITLGSIVPASSKTMVLKPFEEEAKVYQGHALPFSYLFVPFFSFQFYRRQTIWYSLGYHHHYARLWASDVPSYDHSVLSISPSVKAPLIDNAMLMLVALKAWSIISHVLNHYQKTQSKAFDVKSYLFCLPLLVRFIIKNLIIDGTP